MKNIFTFIIVLFCCLKFQAQSSNGNTSTKKSLNQVFSTTILNVYQENSKSKIEDLFSYFQLLTDNKVDADLKKEIIKNIYLLFNKQNPLVVDVTASSLDKISLEKLIQKLMISEPILFKVLDETDYNSVDVSSWKTEFSVNRTKSGLESKIKATQTVYFIQYPKIFGKNSKEVWVTYLGEMN